MPCYFPNVESHKRNHQPPEREASPYQIAPLLDVTSPAVAIIYYSMPASTSCRRRYLLKALHAPPRSNLPIATLDVLKSADGILLGISTRFGTLPAQVKELFDACGDL
ncbi:hypothetical protein PF008_g22454 [Phytophthora fragariae]|uniref:Flavodoxin-like domain-containing protein n=1 Tax=Phytophthora fragariae TaxID=53985 RepID=A0A6G0QTV1_9STRA|nr:hypothetical protein PF008_g22454 [Phytophthora fragariae]